MLEIKMNEKSLAKLLTKENSFSSPSFSVYYSGDSIAVPFVWESKPGTPKHEAAAAAVSKCQYDSNNDLFSNIPPLTPPPSYHQNNQLTTTHSTNSMKRRSNSSSLLNAIFPRLSTHKKTCSISSEISSNSSSSSGSSSNSYSNSSAKNSVSSSKSFRMSRRSFRSPSVGSLSCFDYNGGVVEEEDDHEEVESITCDDSRTASSVSCFGISSTNKPKVIRQRSSLKV